MSERARPRRTRVAAGAGAETTGAPRRSPRVPLLPIAVLGSAAVLLATAWTTGREPGAVRPAPERSRFALDLPPEQQAAINSWERFFICYDLLDARIIDLTLRANQSATGSLDFPGARVEVELPAADAGQLGAGGAGEDELIAIRRNVLDAAVPARMAQVRQQCGRGGGSSEPERAMDSPESTG